MANPEIASFEGLWKGGYFEGDPLDPHGASNYSIHDVRHGYADQVAYVQGKGVIAKQMGFLSTLYVTYLMAIRNRTSGKTVLEIGPGRGAWTKALLADGAKLVYALDALPADHNGFFEYVGEEARSRVIYSQVEDFECTPVPDQSIHFMFSFGCFCHISRVETETYFKHIAQKMIPGAHGFVMISDYGKLDSTLAMASNQSEDQTPSPGRWYHLGTEWFCSMIESYGFILIDSDIGCNIRDPIVHFYRR